MLSLHHLSLATRHPSLAAVRRPLRSSNSSSSSPLSPFWPASPSLPSKAPSVRAKKPKPATNNPRGIVFFEPKIAKGGKGGLDGETYKDPWGGAYTVTLDYDYDNRIDFNATGTATNYFTTVIVESSGPDTDATTKTDNISNVK